MACLPHPDIVSPLRMGCLARMSPARAWGLVLALIGCLLAQRGLSSGAGTLEAWGFDGLLLGGLIAGGRWLVRGLDGTSEQFRSAAIGLVLLALAAAGIESWVCGVVGQELAFELFLLVILRNVVLVLAVLDQHRQLQPLAVAFSLFLVLVAISVGQGSTPWVWLLMYGMAGSCWLVAWYWQSLSGTLPAETVRSATLRWSLVVPVALAGFMVWAALQSYSPRGPLGSLFPTSGGTEAHDPTARLGVHDGDMLVAGHHDARAFGPVDSELFLDSDRPSLYDIFNDQYGEPPPRRNTDRSVALPPSLAMEVEQRMAQSGASGREFSTVREARRSPGELEDQPQPVLFHLAGRTPFHLRLEVFDLFDGTNWLVEPHTFNRPPMAVETVEGRPWIRIPAVASAGLVDGHDLHVLRIQRLDTNRIPTPWHPIGVHIDRVDQPEFFTWHRDTVLGMPRQSLPDSTVIQLQSRPLQPSRLASIDLIASTAHDRYRLLGQDPDSQWLRHIAREWTQGLPPGAPQITAICERLKRSGQLIRGGAESAAPPQSIRQFLENGCAGPDYLFASSAALLLRGLGYSTRLVSGFYADPARYEANSRSTPVAPRDVHFWAEVYVGSGTWVEVEATPGYELLTTPDSWLTRLYRRLVAMGQLALSHAWGGTMILVALAWGVWKRHLVQERVATALWHCRPEREPRRRVLDTLTLVELRRSLSGLRATAGTTPRQRMQPDRFSFNPMLQRDLQRFLQCVDWAAFDPTGPCPIPPDEVESLCGTVTRHLTQRQWEHSAESSPVPVYSRLSSVSNPSSTPVSLA